MQALTAFILAGGKSLRLGRDKAFAILGKQTLLRRALETAREVTPNVVIVGASKKFAAFGQVVEDIYTDRGPLAGIHAALRSSATELNLILAVDLPHVSVELMRYLVAQAQASTALVTLPQTSDGWQPLCAVYRKAFAETAELALQQNQNAIHPLVEISAPCIIDEAGLEREGFSLKMFHNINTESDLLV